MQLFFSQIMDHWSSSSPAHDVEDSIDYGRHGHLIAQYMECFEMSPKVKVKVNLCFQMGDKSSG